MNQIRTSMRRDDLRVLLGPSASGPEARAKDKVLAVTKHRRLLEALAEAIAANLEEGVAAKIIEGANGETAPFLTARQVSQREERLDELNARIAEYDEAIEASVSDVVAEAVRSRRDAEANEVAGIEAELEASRLGERPLEPVTEVEVADLLRGLAEIRNGSPEGAALKKLLHHLRPTAAGVLNIQFETSLLIPGDDDNLLALGPIRFSVESTRRHPSKIRTAAMAQLCFEKGWPVSVVAAGVPLVCSPYTRHHVARTVSRHLRSPIGGKSASVVAGCEVPEVMAVVSRHLGLGQPETEVAEDLEARIVKTYVEGDPLGAKAWYPDSEAAQVGDLLRRIRDHGSVAAETETGLPYARWEERGWLNRRGDGYVQPKCRCGSEALALIPTPEPDGLVCLDCRRDRTGLHFPGSWNTALVDAAYWEAAGKDVSVPPTPGLPRLQTITEALALR